jgi:hypothetical protein
MSNLESLSFDQINKIYSKHFTLGYLGSSMSDKMACIALTCSITNELKKKSKKVTCYDVLLKVGKHSGFTEKDAFLKALGAICEDFMYGCKDFLDFGIPAQEQPKQLKKLLDKYCPF